MQIRAYLSMGAIEREIGGRRGIDANKPPPHNARGIPTAYLIFMLANMEQSQFAHK